MSSRFGSIGSFGSIVAIATCACALGCRINFDPLGVDPTGDGGGDGGGDDGSTLDAPSSLACGEILDLDVVANGTSASGARLSLAITGPTRSYVAAWSNAAGDIEYWVTQLVGNGGSTLARGTLAANDARPTTGGGAATVMIGGSGATSTKVWLLDGTTGWPPPATPIGLTSVAASTSRATVIIDPGSPFKWGTVGDNGGTTRSMIIDSVGNVTLQGTSLGTNASDVGVSLYDGIVIFAVAADQAGLCTVRTVKATMTMPGTPTTFASSCARPSMVASNTHGTVMIGFADPGAGTVRAALGTFDGTTFAFDTATKLIASGTEPRVAFGPTASVLGYWISYVTNSGLAAVHVDDTAAIDKTMMFGAIADATAHEIIYVDNAAYLVWLTPAKMRIAQLCAP